MESTDKATVNSEMMTRASENRGLQIHAPAKLIRYSVEEKSRFVPATVEQWLKVFSIDDCPAETDKEHKY